MRKVLRTAVLLVALGTAMVCSGCSHPKQQASGKVVTLRLVDWGSPKDEARARRLLAVFEKEHPNIRVNLEITPWGRVFDKLMVSFAGGRAPDVSRVSSMWFYPLAAKGILQDLTPFIEQDKSFDLNDFYPRAIDGWGRYKGRIHALPTDLDLTAMYYNKKLFDKAHVPYPDATWNWDKFLWAARKLTKDTDGDGKVDQWGTSGDDFWESYVYQNGGDVLNADHTRCLLSQPEAYEGIQWMADLRQRWHVAPSSADTSDVGTTGLWTMGRIAMFPSGSWAAAMVFKDAITTFDWDVAPVPKGKQRATFLGGAAFTMMRSSKHRAEAWELVKFLTGPYFQAEMARECQIMPSRRSVAESGAFMKLSGPPAHRKVFVDAAEYGRTLPNVGCQREMSDIIMNFISLATLGRTTAKDACDKITPKIDELLKYERNR